MSKKKIEVKYRVRLASQEKKTINRKSRQKKSERSLPITVKKTKKVKFEKINNQLLCKNQEY